MEMLNVNSGVDASQLYCDMPNKVQPSTSIISQRPNVSRRTPVDEYGDDCTGLIGSIRTITLCQAPTNKSSTPAHFEPIKSKECGALPTGRALVP